MQVYFVLQLIGIIKKYIDLDYKQWMYIYVLVIRLSTLGSLEIKDQSIIINNDNSEIK